MEHFDDAPSAVKDAALLHIIERMGANVGRNRMDGLWHASAPGIHAWGSDMRTAIRALHDKWQSAGEPQWSEYTDEEKQRIRADVSRRDAEDPPR